MKSANYSNTVNSVFEPKNGVEALKDFIGVSSNNNHNLLFKTLSLKACDA